VLSLSPGPASLTHAAEMAQYAQMWRIADDLWDGWTFPPPWPNGLLSAFDHLAKWEKYARPGNWPDADMLPWGSLRPHPGEGQPRQSRLTHDEERTQLTLWAIARSPLILGNNLTEMDDFIRGLITSREVIALNQTATASGELPQEGDERTRVRLWSATTRSGRRYLAVFNLQSSPLEHQLPWPDGKVYDVWNRRPIARAGELRVELAPHACRLFRIESVPSAANHRPKPLHDVI